MAESRGPRTPDQLLAEVQSLHTAGWKGDIFIVDDNFIGNKQKVKTMLRKLIIWQKQHKYPFQLLTEASINLAEDDELLHLMSKANFSKVFLGLETPNIESLQECSKLQNTSKDMTAAVHRIHQHGMQVMGGFIVGFDNDTDNIFDRQIKFIQQSGVVTAMVGILNAIPKTRLWDRLQQEGRILDGATGENTDGSLNFIPKMGIDNLKEGYQSIIKTIYNRRNYYKRIKTFLKQYQPTAKSRFKKNDLRAFIRSTWRIGIVSHSRFLYWKLLLRTFFTKKRALPTAIELAIYGLHFEKMAKRVV